MDPELISAHTGITFERIEGDPQEFNAYSYVTNRPTIATDPTGEFGLLGAGVGGGLQLFREIVEGSFENGVMTKEGAKAIARITVAAGVGAVTGGVGSVVSKNVVGVAGKELVKTVATNAASNAAVGAAASGVGQVAVNTAEAAIDGGVSGAKEAIAGGSVLDGTGSAAMSGGAFGALGSVAGDAVSSALGASTVFGESGTLSPAGSAIGVSTGNAMGNLSTSDFSQNAETDMTQHVNTCLGHSGGC
jgi:hypothetical protein